MAKIYEKGASDLIVGVVGADGTFGTSSKKIPGVIEVTIDVEETLTKIAADNNIGYIVLKSVARGSGELNITGVPVEDYPKITSAVENTAGIVAFGEEAAAKHCGFSFKKKYFIDGVEHANVVMMHNVAFGIPSEGAVTEDEEGNSITECTIPFEIMPAEYVEGTTNKRRTLTKLNSSANAALYTALKDKCFMPAEASLDGCVVTFTKTPEAAIVTVLFGTTVIPAQADGTYKLTTGSYTYNASAEGYTSTTGTALVIGSEDITAGAKAVTVTLTQP